jgi:hypothetical protein
VRLYSVPPLQRHYFITNEKGEEAYPKREVDQPYWWACEKKPPAIGSKVRVLMWKDLNHVGTVIAYEVFADWLMIWVKMDSRPAWLVKNEPERDECCFAGIELEWE